MDGYLKKKRNTDMHQLWQMVGTGGANDHGLIFEVIGVRFVLSIFTWLCIMRHSIS